MEFTHITLQTSQLQSLKEFYTSFLGLELLSDLLNEFSIKIGRTQLTFIEVDTSNSNPFYHFAINIPHNLLSEAKAWLTPLVELHSDEGEDEVFFEAGMHTQFTLLILPAISLSSLQDIIYKTEVPKHLINGSCFTLARLALLPMMSLS